MSVKERQQVLGAALNFDMERVLESYAQKHDVPFAVAQEIERELKRFLVLCALKPEKSYGLSLPVDGLWHEFIVDTTKYSSFCEQVAGRYLHHVPDSKSAAPAMDEYEDLLRDYQEFFDEDPPSHIWPRQPNAGELTADCRGPASCHHP